MAVRNPELGKRGGQPETGILPRSQGGAASVTVNPRTPGQVDRLQRYLYTKTNQQYAKRIQALAAHHGVTVNGRVTDPTVAFKLRNRASFAANSIHRTFQHQMAQTRANGGTLADLVQRRNQYKQDQIFTTEMATADRTATADFYTAHPELQDAGTYHVEPTTAEEPKCQDAIAMGSVPYDQIPDFDHPGCPHIVVPDPVPDTTELIPAGTVTTSGAYFPDAVTIGTATAAALQAADWWVAGMVITAAMGDGAEDDTTDQPDDGSDDGESTLSPAITEKKSDAEKTRKKLHQHMFTVGLDLDDTALQFPEILVPLVKMLVAQGAQVGVITGNESLKAQVTYRKLGYPEPRFYVTHSADSDLKKLGKWKAEQCASLGVNLMIDDFRHGDLLDAFMKHKSDWCLPLVVPFDKDAPYQFVGRAQE